MGSAILDGCRRGVSLRCCSCRRCRPEACSRHRSAKTPYTNPESQHKTQVEPDSFALGNTVVTAFQTGRVFDGGASNIAWATTTNAGRTWTTGNLPGTTIHEGGPWARISDPAVAYDPEHDVWMISTLAFGTAAAPFGAPAPSSRAVRPTVGSRGAIPVTASLGPSSFYDKNWIACDTWPSSPHYGNCYTEWDDTGLGNRILMSTSTDGGLTWGPAISPGGLPSGLGGHRSSSRTGQSSFRIRRTSVGFVSSGRRTAAELDELDAGGDADDATASPVACATRRCRRPRSTGRARCTSSGTTAASVPGARPNDIVMSTHETASCGPRSCGSRSTR